jgi:hypothetical protein
MKYALLIYSDPGDGRRAEEPPRVLEGVIDNWLDYTVALRESGVLLAAEQLQPTDTATSVRMPDTERVLTDGPFIETKEHLLGFYLLDVPDLDTALDWAARTPIMRVGTVEVRPVVEGASWRKPLD